VNRGYYRRIYYGHLWPGWYRAQAVKHRNTDLTKCCGQCQAQVESWKGEKPVEAK